MAPFSLLLLCTSLLTSVLASSLPSNLWDRDSGVMHYSVYPVDSAHSTQITRTESLLKHLCGDEGVVPVQNDHTIDSWIVTVKDDSETKQAIEALEGVRLVEQHNESGSPSVPPEQNPLEKRDFDRYLVFPNGTSDEQKTEDFLKTKNQHDMTIYQWRHHGKLMAWYNIVLTAEAKEEVEKHEGIEYVRIEPEINFNRALPVSANIMPLIPTVPTPSDSSLHRRSGTWMKQEKADKALIMDSQFPGSDINNFADFVHTPHPGKGVVVYILDAGIQIKVQNPGGEREFITDNDKVLQTPASRDRNEKDDADDGPKDSHGTMVASKAVGKRYGLAKEATLISVKFTPHAGPADYLAALEMIVNDIEAHPGRELHSVPMTSVNLGSYLTTDIINKDEFWWGLLEPIKTLLNLGVPFVCTAGNKATFPNRQMIDEFPPAAQDPGTPLINVGAAKYDGERLDISQYGNQLTIYAPGDDVEYQTKRDGKSGKDFGTSIAAPQVAGLIATYMSMNQRPWDDSLRGIDRVKAIRDYLVSKDSSWERQKGSGINIIWNGAKEEDHKNAGANGLSNPSSPPSPPPQAPKTKALSIILQNYIDESSNDMTWLFFATDYGASVLCHSDKKALLKTKAARATDIDNPPWPGGSYQLKFDGMNCEYKNDGTNAGALWCKERNGPITCKADDMRAAKKSKVCDAALWRIEQHAVVACEW